MCTSLTLTFGMGQGHTFDLENEGQCQRREKRDLRINHVYYAR